MDISDELQLIINKSYILSKKNGDVDITPEHIFLVSLDYPTIPLILNSVGVTINKFRARLENHIKNDIAKNFDASPKETPELQKLLESAFDISIKNRGKFVDVSDIFLAIFSIKKSFVAQLLKEYNLSKKKFETIIYSKESNFFRLSPLDSYDIEDEDEFDELIKENDEEFLNLITDDLTLKAKRGKLNPFTGREKIIEDILIVLNRKFKNNPLLIGDTGVGKTAIVEGVAKLFAQKKVEGMENKKILQLNVGSLVAGTKYRGDFEHRVEKLIKLLEEQEDVILFIDEMHNLIGAGSTGGGSLDASGMLKPAISQGKINCIGITTLEDYKKYFESNSAFSRRFQTIDVGVPNFEETKKILKKVKLSLEKHHNVVIPKNLLNDVIDISDKFLREKNQPDKSIDLLDQAATLLSFKNGKKIDKPVLTISFLEKIISGMLNVPEKNISESDLDKLNELEKKLKNKIFGQDVAIEKIVLAIKREKAGFREDDKTIASFLFVGPTGVGKTEISKQLATILGINIIRFDMSEYQEKHSVSKLIGAPPGYVGYQEGGLLIDAVKKNPNAVLLLDEIEKAHYDIYNVLLQIMDYAMITDSLGRKADFRNIILIMTSNVGASKLEKDGIGFLSDENLEDNKNKLNSSLTNVFSSEFRNRLDDIIYFNNLSKESILDIVNKNINEFKQLLKKKKISLKIEEKCLKYIADKGFSKKFGARNISRTIDSELKPLFIDEVLFGKLKKGGNVFAYLEDDKIKIKILNSSSIKKTNKMGAKSSSIKVVCPE